MRHKHPPQNNTTLHSAKSAGFVLKYYKLLCMISFCIFICVVLLYDECNVAEPYQAMSFTSFLGTNLGINEQSLSLSSRFM